jgi:hypothetical protein
MMRTGSAAMLGVRALADAAARPLLTGERRADFASRERLPAFLAVFAVLREAVLADRPALFAECLLMDMNIAAYFLSVRSFLPKTACKINGLP